MTKGDEMSRRFLWFDLDGTANNGKRFNGRRHAIGRFAMPATVSAMAWNCLALCFAAAVGWSATAAMGQVRAAHIGYVYPAGGQRGTTVEVCLGGQFLDGASAAHFTAFGIKATVVDHFKPLTQAQFARLREELDELLSRRAAAIKAQRNSDKESKREVKATAKGDSADKQKAGDAPAAPAPVWTEKDDQRINEIRKQMATFVRRPANPAIAELVTLKVEIAPDAPVGDTEIRLITSSGMSNPMVFHVGVLPETVQKRSGVQENPRFAERAFENRRTEPSQEIAVSLPAAVNGQIMPGEVDRFRFSAKRGQRITADAYCRRLIPYLADAVPGWFQATLTLYDAHGKELVYVDDYRFSPDPVVLFEIPADGEYVLEIKDAIYRGREDFVYRIVIGELPFITSLFPLGGPADKPGSVVLEGWNLPRAELALDAGLPPGTHLITLTDEEHRVSNAVPISIDTLPERLEREPNDDVQKAQPLALPMIVNGRILQGNDRDVFSFVGRRGQKIVVDVNARRLGSPLDSIVRVTDAAGNRIASNDDYEDKSIGLLTHHADSYLQVELPADGTYYVWLSDSQSHGGPAYAYRLRVSEPRPDFAVRVAPASLRIRSGTWIPVSVYAARRDGFDGEIQLRAKNPLPGWSLSGARIPPGKDEIRMTITGPAPSDKQTPIPLAFEAVARVGDQEIVRPVTPADDMMQAFAYRHLVPCETMLAMVDGTVRGSIRLDAKTPVRIVPGKETIVPFITGFGGGLPRAEVELAEGPEGLTLKTVNNTRAGIEVVVAADAAQLKPGTTGNLIFELTPKGFLAGKRNGKAAGGAVVASLPAVPFEVVAP